MKRMVKVVMGRGSSHGVLGRLKHKQSIVINGTNHDLDGESSPFELMTPPTVTIYTIGCQHMGITVARLNAQSSRRDVT